MRISLNVDVVSSTQNFHQQKVKFYQTWSFADPRNIQKMYRELNLINRTFPIRQSGAGIIEMDAASFYKSFFNYFYS